MIEFAYDVEFDRAALLTLENQVLGGVRTSMQDVLDNLVGVIKAKFDDQKLADTVEGHVTGADVAGQRDQYEIVGTVTSTWPEMIWYEQGRPPGGKMPPKQALIGWSVRKGLQPDPAKTQLAFAYAINASRINKDKKAIPLDVLVEWINKNGFTPSEQFAFDSMAYAIGLKIVRTGILGHHYFQQGLEENRAFIQQSFEQTVISTQGI
jgi:hypothetical protein